MSQLSFGSSRIQSCSRTVEQFGQLSSRVEESVENVFCVWRREIILEAIVVSL
jgi:hypothetical protein